MGAASEAATASALALTTRETVTTSSRGHATGGAMPSRHRGARRMMPTFQFIESSYPAAADLFLNAYAPIAPTRKKSGDARRMQMKPSPKTMPERHSAIAIVLLTVPTLDFG